MGLAENKQVQLHVRCHFRGRSIRSLQNTCLKDLRASFGRLVHVSCDRIQINVIQQMFT